MKEIINFEEQMSSINQTTEIEHASRDPYTTDLRTLI